MTNTSAPFGAQPIYNQIGPAPRPTAYLNGITSGYSTSIYYGSPVRLNDGAIQLATSNQSIIGFFQGCKFQAPGSIIPSFLNYWPASTTYVAGTLEVFVWDNPNYTYEIQCGSSVTQSSIGDQANIINAGSGNSTTFISTAALNGALAGAGNTGQLRIVGLSELQNNEWGDTYPVVKVQIAAYQYASQAVAI